MGAGGRVLRAAGRAGPRTRTRPTRSTTPGLLREHLGDTQAAIAPTASTPSATRRAEDAKEVAFRVGVVLAGCGTEGGGGAARSPTMRATHPAGAAVEALTRAGAAYIAAGQYKKAEEPLQKAVSLYKRGDDKATAGARRRTPATCRARSCSTTTSACSWPRSEEAASAARREGRADGAGQAGLPRRRHLPGDPSGPRLPSSASARPTSASPRRCAARRCRRS